jgi:hypothetical protein
LSASILRQMAKPAATATSRTTIFFIPGSSRTAPIPWRHAFSLPAPASAGSPRGLKPGRTAVDDCGGRATPGPTCPTPARTSSCPTPPAAPAGCPGAGS